MPEASLVEVQGRRAGVLAWGSFGVSREHRAGDGVAVPCDLEHERGFEPAAIDRVVRVFPTLNDALQELLLERAV